MYYEKFQPKEKLWFIEYPCSFVYLTCIALCNTEQSIYYNLTLPRRMYTYLLI